MHILLSGIAPVNSGRSFGRTFTMHDQLLTNLNVATCRSDKDDASAPVPTPYGLISDACVAVKDRAVSWVGPAAELPENLQELPRRDLHGHLLTPSLIDCHTHIVHGGNRAIEFEQRLSGVSYTDIAASGGGIVSTVSATRTASVEELVESALPRVDSLLAEAVSVIEIKSGYGLDLDTELNMLRAARRIGELRPVTVITSFLGAHAVPAEYRHSADDYIDKVCIPALVAAHNEGLVDTVDGFCESIAFDTRQIRRVFDKARQLELPVKLHAEQLSNLGGAQLAAEFGAQSADHLEYLDKAGVSALQKAGTIAVLLPGAFYTLHETQAPPVELLRQHHVPIAIATDCNPGSSPLSSLLMTMNMACTLFKLTPEEALLGATRHAALALGMIDRGYIGPGAVADFAVWQVDHPAELCYRMGFNPLSERITY